MLQSLFNFLLGLITCRENIKDLHYWHFMWESTFDWWIPFTMWPVMQKALPFFDVIIFSHHLLSHNHHLKHSHSRVYHTTVDLTLMVLPLNQSSYCLLLPPKRSLLYFLFPGVTTPPLISSWRYCLPRQSVCSSASTAHSLPACPLWVKIQKLGPVLSML